MTVTVAVAMELNFESKSKSRRPPYPPPNFLVGKHGGLLRELGGAGRRHWYRIGGGSAHNAAKVTLLLRHILHTLYSLGVRAGAEQIGSMLIPTDITQME